MSGLGFPVDEMVESDLHQWINSPLASPVDVLEAIRELEIKGLVRILVGTAALVAAFARAAVYHQPLAQRLVMGFEFRYSHFGC